MATTTTGAGLLQAPGSTSTPSKSKGKGEREENNNDSNIVPDILPLMNGNAASDQLYIHRSRKTNNRGDTDGRQALITKRASRNSAVSTTSSTPQKEGLTRSESGHSLGALSYTNYDPKTTGSLSRSEEVNISLYEQGPHKRSYESLIDDDYGQREGKAEENVEIQWRSATETGTLGETEQGGTASITGGSKLKRSSYRDSNSHEQYNGHAESGGMKITSESVTSTTSSQNKRQSMEGGGGGGGGDSGGVILMSSTKRLSQELDTNGIKDSGVTTEKTVTKTSSIDRKSTGRPRKPTASQSTGTFQMRSAYNSLPKNEPKSPAASDENFRGALADTLSRKVEKSTTVTTTTSTSATGGGSKKASSSPKTPAKSDAGLRRSNSGGKRSSSARGSRIEADVASSKAASGSGAQRSGSVTKSDVATENVRLIRHESAASQKSRVSSGGTDLTKRESVRSTASTASTDPGRPPSGKGGRLSRSSSTTDQAVSPRSSTSTYNAGTPSKRSESTKSTTSIKASSLERLAEPKHRKSISNERKERRGSVDSGSGRRGSVDSTSGRRGSGSDSGSTRRDSVGKKESPSGSRSSSKEGKRASTVSAGSATDQKSPSVKSTKTTKTVTKTDSTRSGSSARSYAASTSASSAKRSESGRSSTGKQSAATSRSPSNASNKGQFSIKHSTGSVSPPGSVFDMAEDEVGAEKKRDSVLSVDTSGAKVKRASSNISQRKVTDALSRTPSKGSQEKKTPVTTKTGSAPVRTSSLLKAETKHKAISKSLFSELHAKHGNQGTEDTSSDAGKLTEKGQDQEQVIVKHEEIVISEAVPSVTNDSLEEFQPSLARTETTVTKTVTSETFTSPETTGAEDNERQERPPSLIEKRRGSRESLSLDLSKVDTASTGQQVGGTEKLGEHGSRAIPGDYDVANTAPLSPLRAEAQQTVKHGTVGSLVKGKFKDLNLTARLMDASSAKKEADTSDEATGGKPKYKFLVEGIDVPKTEENKDSLVGTSGSVEEASIAGGETSGAYYQEGTLTNFSTLSSTTSGGDSNYTLTRTDQEDSAPSEGNSLERSHKPKRGFTYILDEKLAEEVTKRASTVTARKPHEQADKVHEYKVSTLEREKEEKALQDARAKLTKAQPVEKSHSVIPGSEPETAYGSLLRGIRERGGNTNEKKIETVETVVSVSDVQGNGRENTGLDGSSTEPGSISQTTGGRASRVSIEKTTEIHKSSPTTSRGVKSSGTEGVEVSEMDDKNMRFSNTTTVAGGRESTGGVERRGGNGPTTMKISSNLGQLSPDSAYQSDSAGSPAFEGKNSSLSNTRGGSTKISRDIKLEGGGAVAVGGGTQHPHEVTVQRMQQDETVAQGAHSRYESKQTVLSENKVSNKTLSEPGVSGRGLSKVNEYSTSSQQTRYSKSYTSSANDGDQHDGPGRPGDNYVISTRRNESVTRVGGGPGESVVSSATGGSTYTDRHTNFNELYKPSELVEQPRRSTKYSVQQNVTRSTKTTTTKTQGTGAAGGGGAAAAAGDTAVSAGYYEASASGPASGGYDLKTVTARGGGGGEGGGVHSDVIGKQETVLTSQNTASQTAANRHYLPVGEDGGVRMTVGELGTGSTEGTLRSTTTSTNTTTATTLPDINAAPMRVENKENVSHKVVRESNYSSNSSVTLPGGSERHPLGNHSSFGSADYSSANGNKQQGNRVIPLAPLTVDINTPNDSFEMATHPASVTSPTVKHTMTMFEMSEMTDGASGNFGRAPYDGYYDGPYGGSLQHSGGYSGSRYMPPARPHFEDGLDFQNLHNLRNTYQEQTLSSQQSSYRSSQYNEYMDGGSGGGFDTVSRSFRHIPGSPSQPKYLKVDESRSGTMPMYRENNISLRESGVGVGGAGYRHGIQGYAGRNRAESNYVSRAYVEGEQHDLYGDPYDGDSVKSEPAYNRTRRSEKILSNRRPLRRHASSVSGNAAYHTLPSRRVHLDEPSDMSSGAYNSYQDGGGSGGWGTMRSSAHRSHSSLYSPPGGDGPPIVSPELQGARKKQDLYGDEYHITLKLNQLNKDIGASRASLHSARSERVDLRDDQRYSSSSHLLRQQRGGHQQENMYTSAMSLPDMHTSYNSRGGGYDNHEDYTSLREDRYHYGDEGYGGSPTRTVTHVELESPQVREQFEDRLSWYRARRAAQQQEAQFAPTHVDVSATNGYHHNTSSSFTSSAAPPPRVTPQSDADYTMSIDQTMTMGYVPTNKPPQPEPQPVLHSSTPQKTNIYISADENRNVGSQRVLEQEEVTTYDETDESGEPIPQVVRGSILIKNTIDTAGKPRVIDVVADDDEEEFTVEDNSNMFHGKYFQARENPMYNSDEDLSRLHRKPAFTKIFSRSDAEEYTEIPVNYGRASTSGKSFTF